MKIITVSAVVFIRQDGMVLTVRKGGTTGFMMPGGKPEVGEDARATALREVQEELGLVLDDQQLEELGVFDAAALNEPGMVVRGHVFVVRNYDAQALAHLQPAAEIAELKWVDPAVAIENQADLNVSYIFPAVVALRGARKRVKLSEIVQISLGGTLKMGEFCTISVGGGHTKEKLYM